MSLLDDAERVATTYPALGAAVASAALVVFPVAHVAFLLRLVPSALYLSAVVACVATFFFGLWLGRLGDRYERVREAPPVRGAEVVDLAARRAARVVSGPRIGGELE
jgi:hypothetical protein